jgi:L-alanine-DL-glutamate epimerase-like enolase superfamily enzyme
MKISRISVFQVDVTLGGDGYWWAKNRGTSVVDTTVVRIDTDEGFSGWGETTPLGSNYLPAYGPGIRTGTSTLAPHLLGLDPTLLGPLNRVMDCELEGHGYAKSAIDVACWDILGRSLGTPVHRLLGGRQQASLEMYGSVAQATPARMAEVADDFRARGYRQIQIKVGDDPLEDAARLAAVAANRRAGEIILADANRGWRRDEALRFASATADIDYVMEQPCDRTADNLSVRRRVQRPFKLDETLRSVDDVLAAIADDAMDVACIKISKFGGLTKARLARDVCAAVGIPMTVEDTWGCEIVTAALGHLAISTPAEAFLNTTDLQAYNTVHLGAPSAQAFDGRLVVSDAPGLGVEPDLDVLGQPVFTT